MMVHRREDTARGRDVLVIICLMNCMYSVCVFKGSRFVYRDVSCHERRWGLVLFI